MLETRTHVIAAPAITLCYSNCFLTLSVSEDEKKIDIKREKKNPLQKPANAVHMYKLPGKQAHFEDCNTIRLSQPNVW